MHCTFHCVNFALNLSIGHTGNFFYSIHCVYHKISSNLTIGHNFLFWNTTILSYCVSFALDLSIGFKFMFQYTVYTINLAQTWLLDMISCFHRLRSLLNNFCVNSTVYYFVPIHAIVSILNTVSRGTLQFAFWTLFPLRFDFLWGLFSLAYRKVPMGTVYLKKTAPLAFSWCKLQTHLFVRSK